MVEEKQIGEEIEVLHIELNTLNKLKRTDSA
jgi:hypothetical protein